VSELPKMLKILIVSGTFPPRRYGGVTKTTYLVAKKLAERGHEVTVFTTDVGNNEHERLPVQGSEIINGIRVYYFRNLSNVIAFRQRILLPPRMIPVLARSICNFDIVHLNGLRSFHDVAVSYYAKKYGVPYVQQAHGSLPRIKPKRILKLFWDELFGRYLLRGATKVIALNRMETELYRAVGVPEEKIVIIPNGIDLSEYDKLPPKGSFKRKYNIPEDKRIILYLARIDRIKGIDILIKAYAYLIKKMNLKDSVLVIAGPDEGYLNEANSLVRRLSISSYVLFTGPLYDRDKLEALVDTNIYVLPSRYETFPMAVLEASACGKPIVASKVGGLKELIIDGETGLLFEAGNVIQLAKAIHFLVNECKKAEEMGLKGRRLVKEKFAIERVVDKLETLYKEVMS